MKEIKSINLLMKEDKMYSNYINECIEYSIRDIYPSRFRDKKNISI